MPISAEMLLHFQRCQRRAFLDVWGDRDLKDPPSDFQRKLTEERLAHQRSILAEQIRQGAPVHHQPQYPFRDWQAGVKATIELMQQGVERIVRGVLAVERGGGDGEMGRWGDGEMGKEETRGELVTPNSEFRIPNSYLVSYPDLLVKEPGKSIFGDWLYVPIDIHLGKRPKPEYQIVAAYHAYLLGFLQGTLPEKAWLILREKGAYRVELERSLPQMQAILEEYLQTIVQQQEPEVFISRQLCSLCPWLGSCYPIAKSQQHLSLIPGVTPSRYQVLQKLGLTTLESLAQADPSSLEPDLERTVAEQLVRQAKSIWQQEPIAKPHTAFDLARILPTAPIELYFDIEAQPDLNLDYLLGVLVVDRQAQTETFYPLLAEQPADEAAIWQQFLDLVGTDPEVPIFHFSPYEAETIKRLAKLYRTPASQTRALLSRFVDVHQRITSMVTLPIESYSLKAIASWLNFQWRDAEASGAQCICWYDEWLRTSDRSRLDAIARYNEDDCHATYRIKDWLANFLVYDR
ncbi:MAG: TM0106 family RecB-like putative nuclease [Cyanosarcina radialis HA8281-LM2]|jgi:uncharacterized protein|nr:TM0106 family RecB-like putative nuclease [Cyanosarcina radialis HA8281-LM2]